MIFGDGNFAGTQCMNIWEGQVGAVAIVAGSLVVPLHSRSE